MRIGLAARLLPRRTAWMLGLIIPLLLLPGPGAAAAGTPAEAAALGTTVTLRPTADAFVDSAAPRRNFGRADVLEVAPRTKRSYLRFRLRGVSGPVSRALLVLHTEKGAASYTARAARSNRWTERGITFANAPGLGRRGSTARRRGGGTWMAANVTGLVKAGRDVTLVVTAAGGRAGSVASRHAGRDAPRLVVQVGGTADPAAAAAGNIGCDPGDPNFNGGLGTPVACRPRSTADLLVGSGLDAVLMLGDGQYFCGGYQPYLDVYDPTWGGVKAITHPVIGNHDIAPNGGTDCDPSGAGGGYFRYFGAAAGDPSKAYYSFDLGAWHIIALNSNCRVIGCARGSVQQRWLARDLARRGQPCTLAFFHHPRFSSSYVGQQSTNMVQDIWETLAAARVDVVLAAHDHVYERFRPQGGSGAFDPRGVREFIVGTGGHSHHPFFGVTPNSEVRNNTTFGVLRTSLRATSYSWRFVPEAGATFSDSGSATCH